MSQTIAGPGVSYYLTNTVPNDKVTFNELPNPPLAGINEHLLYVLNDNNLYYDGIDISNPSMTADSITFTQVVANPGGSDTLWMKTGGNIYHGDRDTENNDPTSFYVDPYGMTILQGANGWINSPLNTITEAISLLSPLVGITIHFNGDYSAENIDLPPQCIIIGESGLSFRSLLGPVNINSAILGWTDPPPFGLNQSFITNCSCQGLITYDCAGCVSPLLILNNCIIQGGLDATSTSLAPDIGYLLMKDSIIASTINITNINATMTCCSFGLFNFISGDLNITHDNIPGDMTVKLCNSIVNGGNIVINALNTTDVLYVYLEGDCMFNSITVNAVTIPGGLVFYVDDISFPPITWGVGTQANTSIQYIKNAEVVGYYPTTAAEWNPYPVPSTVQIALDQLAHRTTQFNGVTTVTGVNQILTTGNNLTPIYDATGAIHDHTKYSIKLVSWYYNNSRLLVPGESITIRVYVNGAVINTYILNDVSPSTATLPCVYTVPANGNMYVNIEPWVPIGAAFLMSYSLST